MAKQSKRYRKAAARIDRARRYPLDEAIRTLMEAAAEGPAKFDETVELAVKLGVDPRQLVSTENSRHRRHAAEAWLAALSTWAKKNTKANTEELALAA